MEIPIIVPHPLYFNDFVSRLTCPLGRLGAARQPAAEDGIPEEAGLAGDDLRNSSLRCQGQQQHSRATCISRGASSLRLRGVAWRSQHAHAWSVLLFTSDRFRLQELRPNAQRRVRTNMATPSSGPKFLADCFDCRLNFPCQPNDKGGK